MSEELRILIIKVLMKIRINSCSQQDSPQRCPEWGTGRDRRIQSRQDMDDCSCLESPTPAAVNCGVDKTDLDEVNRGETLWGAPVHVRHTP
jgi:hypothetical protein